MPGFKSHRSRIRKSKRSLVAPRPSLRTHSTSQSLGPDQSPASEIIPPSTLPDDDNSTRQLEETPNHATNEPPSPAVTRINGETTVEASAVANGAEKEKQGTKRKRGRPSKDTTAKVTTEKQATAGAIEDTSAQPVANNRRGRPRKSTQAEPTTDPNDEQGTTNHADEGLPTAPPAKRILRSRRKSPPASTGAPDPNVTQHPPQRGGRRSRRGQQPTPQISQPNSTVDSEDIGQATTASDRIGLSNQPPPPTPDTQESVDDEPEDRIQPSVENEFPESHLPAGQSIPTSAQSGQGNPEAPSNREPESNEAVVDANHERGLGDESNINSSNQAGSKDKPKRKRRRLPTPEDYTNHKHEPTEVRMDFLAKETRYGIKSKREAAMQQINWDEVKKRKAAESLEAAQSRSQVRTAPEASLPSGPQLRLDANGQMVVVENSLAHDRAAAAVADIDDMEVVDEDDLTNRVTTQSYLAAERRDPDGRSGRGRGERWTNEDTERFYQALGMFGTDFMIICQMFGNKSRRQIKMKFTREERCNPTRINAALIHSTAQGNGLMDFEAYKLATGKTDADFVPDGKAVLDQLKQEFNDEVAAIEEEKRQKKAMAEQAAANAQIAGAEATSKGKKGKGKQKAPASAPPVAEEGVEILEEFDD